MVGRQRNALTHDEVFAIFLELLVNENNIRSLSQQQSADDKSCVILDPPPFFTIIKVFLRVFPVFTIIKVFLRVFPVFTAAY